MGRTAVPQEGRKYSKKKKCFKKSAATGSKQFSCIYKDATFIKTFTKQVLKKNLIISYNFATAEHVPLDDPIFQVPQCI